MPPDMPPSDVDEVLRLLAEGDAARAQGDIAAALHSYQRASEIAPEDTYARYWLATCHEQAGNLRLARDHCNRGLSVEPEQIGLLLRLGSVAVAGHDHRLALDCYLKASRLDPEIPDIDSMLADQYCFLGQTADGVAHFDHALQRDPASIRLQSNRLFVLNYANLLAPDALFLEHRRWGEAHEADLRDRWRAHQNSRDPDRALRVGYVSGDLRNHAVSFFMEPLLAYHDPNRVRVTCFDVSRYAEDEVTARLKAHGHEWHRAGQLDDDALAETIRSAGIDVLVDLSGHTEMNRLLAFARKPAPVQATWLGYLGTTGLASVDYRITDSYLDPPGATERYHTETLFRLRNAACFAPRADAPEIGVLPAIRNGYVTFGSVNQWSKVNDAVIDSWCDILRNVPYSRLLIVARGAHNAAFGREIVARFARVGVDPTRIMVRPATSLGNFLELFNHLDVTLDPFPYGGGTTTMHSLWMGTPVVTLAGSTAFARNAVGPLTEVGLGDLVAETPAAYVRIAQTLAWNVRRLVEIRGQMRSKMTASSLVSQQSFTRSMEDAFRQMWQRYCQRA